MCIQSEEEENAMTQNFAAMELKELEEEKSTNECNN